MIDQHKVSLFKELFAQAESVLIIYAPDALRDHLFAATALYKTFQQLGNKSITLLSSESLASAEPDIVYLDETRTEVGNKNLCITLDYTPETVEKITSAIDESTQKLYLTIKPKKGVNPLSRENVTFSYTGAEADMVILVGVDDLESLDQLYIGYENLYQNTALVSINSYETSFGNLKLDILGSSSVSEYVALLLRELNYQLDQEVATNLLAGIDEETDNLESYLATADTFEVVSYLLRSGARRFAREAQSDELANNENETEQEVFNQSSQNEDDEVFVVEETVSPQPQILSEKSIPSEPKRGRGRPRGSKNKSKIQQGVQSPEKETNTPKPGDLNYNPSGFGPSST